VIDGEVERTTESRIVRNGELSRQEWTENGERLALIWRPDLGKVFSLSIDRSLYCESSIGPGKLADSPRSDSKENPKHEEPPAVDEFAINRALASPLEPESIEVVVQPDARAGSYACRVTERILRFDAGHIEVIRTYQAIELGGLAIRVECEGPGQRGTTKVITELHDVTLEVLDREFEVPDWFKQVPRL
jgi:hypothetical protein